MPDTSACWALFLTLRKCCFHQDYGHSHQSSLLHEPDQWNSDGWRIAGTAVLGFSLGGKGDITPYLIARFFGRKSFSTVYGLSWTAYAIGGATVPMLMGHLYDRSGGYEARFVIGLACTCIAAAVLNLLLPRRRLSARRRCCTVSTELMIWKFMTRF